MVNREFYIGWLQQAPDQIAGFVKKYLLILIPAVLALAAAIALGQKRFGTGNYEFGKLTKIKGIYFSKPVPMLRVDDGTTAGGVRQWMNIPLVGYGKHGADGIMSALEIARKRSLNGQECTLRGTLLYNDGKTFLEINNADSPLVSLPDAVAAPASGPAFKDLGSKTLQGEIVDPKCFFGVMKPGEGKPHSDCAIRCILGGIAPVFVMRDTLGNANYFLIADSPGEGIRSIIKPYVGRQVALKAKLVQYDDWIVMYLGDDAGIHNLSYLEQQFGNNVVACSAH